MKLPSRGKNRADEVWDFANELKKISRQIGFKVSARGWCYILEQNNLITKAQFSVVENLINNDCRRDGTLPIDFVAEEEARKFSGVEKPDKESPVKYIERWLDGALNAENYYTPNWWKEEEYYIQMVVEKIDLKTLFKPVCKKFHIPIATSKGWSSMLQRAEYARRFKAAEEMGLSCILLYCGDHDPDGTRISYFLRKNLEDLVHIEWEDGMDGYNPQNLKIDSFGLKYDFIIANDLSWIDNLITASGGYIAEMVNGKIVQGKTKKGRPHPNFHLPYAQDYLKKYGVRKCEANALVVRPEQGRELCQQTIKGYLGEDARKRFQERRGEIIQIIDEFRERTGLNETIHQAIELIESEEKEEL